SSARSRRTGTSPATRPIPPRIPPPTARRPPRRRWPPRSPPARCPARPARCRAPPAPRPAPPARRPPPPAPPAPRRPPPPPPPPAEPRVLRLQLLQQLQRLRPGQHLRPAPRHARLRALLHGRQRLPRRPYPAPVARPHRRRPGRWRRRPDGHHQVRLHQQL